MVVEGILFGVDDYFIGRVVVFVFNGFFDVIDFFDVSVVGVSVENGIENRLVFF